MQYVHFKKGSETMFVAMITGRTGLRIVREEAAPFVFAGIKRLSIDAHAVVMQYRNGACAVLNLELPMNILDHLELEGAKNAPLKAATAESRVFIAPQADVLPDDGTFDFRTVEAVSGLMASTTPRTVLMFGSDDKGKRLLAMFVEYADVIGVQPVVLTGIPRADYSSDFENSVFACPKAAYHEVFEESVSDAVHEEKTVRSDKSEKGRSSRRETKFEDGGGRFSKFDVAPFGAGTNRRVSSEEDVVGGEGE